MNMSALLEHRNEKDQLIKSTNSPFPSTMREKFSGLNYYAPTELFYFEVEIEEYNPKTKIEIDKTDHQILTAKRFGRAYLSVEEQTIPVEIFEYEGNLAIIFKDKTSGTETYGGGRSLPVVSTEHGTYVIDFNLATNPMCAYMSGYSCPIPPPENHLEIAITAGEKMPVGDWVMFA